MSIRFEPVRVASEEGEGRLVYDDDVLVGLLVRLGPVQGEAAGRWFVEMLIGREDGAAYPIHENLDQAAAWFSGRLADAPPSGPQRD